MRIWSPHWSLCHVYLCTSEMIGDLYSSPWLISWFLLLRWRKSVLHIAIEWLPTHMVLFYIMSSQDEYFMDENNTVGNTSKSLVLHSLNFPVWGSVFSVLRKKKLIFPLMLTFLHLHLPSVSWLTQSRLIRSKTAIGSYHVVSQSMSLSSKDPVLPSCSHHVFPSFHALFCHQSFIQFDLFLCASLFFSCQSLSLSFFLSLSQYAALFTVWKCLKLPATTYYKMHSSRAWISVWLWQPQCILGKRERGDLEGKERRKVRGEGLCPTVPALCAAVRC